MSKKLFEEVKTTATTTLKLEEGGKIEVLGPSEISNNYRLNLPDHSYTTFRPTVEAAAEEALWTIGQNKKSNMRYVREMEDKIKTLEYEINRIKTSIRASDELKAELERFLEDESSI
jgi:hypothetical protein